MPRLINAIRSRYQSSLERHRNRPFLEAAMAALALVAIADGDACRREGARVGEILRTLDLLQMFDPDEGLHLFLRYVAAVRRDSEAGHEEVYKALRDGASDAEGAAMVVALCQSVSEADGRVTDDERGEILRICDVLGVDEGTIADHVYDLVRSSSDPA